MQDNSRFCGKTGRTRRHFSPPLLIVLLLLSLSGPVIVRTHGAPAKYFDPQSRPSRTVNPSSGEGHMLFGDFKVDDSKVSGPKPETFTIILYTITNSVVARDTVSNRGRYRFLNVQNGDYYIIVEVDNREVARLSVKVMDPQKTEIRHDIELEWRGDPVAGESKKGSATVAAGYDKRTLANQALFDKALDAIRKNDARQAGALLNQVVSADARDFEAWTELGTLYFKQDKTGDAEKAYTHALTERPTYLLALLNLGRLRISLKNFEGAIECLSRAVEVEPQSADANFFLGEAYLQIRKGSKAVGYLNEAIRLDPVGKADAHLRLAALYRAAGLKDKAWAEYEQFLAKKPDYPEKKMIQQYITENKKP